MVRLEELGKLLEKRGLMSVGELKDLGYHKTYLSELEKRGIAIRQAHGTYMYYDADIPPHFNLSLACQQVPRGIICLLSALSFHGIGTQAPNEVWMAIDSKARKPKVEYPSMRFVRFSGLALSEGVELMDAPFGFKVYTPAKTVVDCFKYRNKFGIDIALEALREGWSARRFTIDELNMHAKNCRMENVMNPYIETILS